MAVAAHEIEVGATYQCRIPFHAVLTVEVLNDRNVCLSWPEEVGGGPAGIMTRREFADCVVGRVN